MDLPTALATHLRDLADGVGTGNDGVADALATLDADLRTAVSSYAGLRLTLVLPEWPVTLTAFPGIDGMRPATSLRVVLSALGSGFDPGSEIVLYAYTPGAFTDLAADLDYLQREGRTSDPGRPAPPLDPDRGGRRPVLALDADLPAVTVVSGVSGLAEYSAINRAVGVLMWRGQTPDQALGTLRRDARAAGLPLPGYVARLLAD